MLTTKLLPRLTLFTGLAVGLMGAAQAQQQPTVTVGDDPDAVAGGTAQVSLDFTAGTPDLATIVFEIEFDASVLTPQLGATGNPSGPVLDSDDVENCLSNIPATHQTAQSVCNYTAPTAPNTTGVITVGVSSGFGGTDVLPTTTPFGSITFTVDGGAVAMSYPLTVTNQTGTLPDGINEIFAPEFVGNNGTITVIPTNPDISATPNPVAFLVNQNATTPITLAATVTNSGNANGLDITAVGVPGTADFSFVSEDCTTLSPLAIGAECTVTVSLDNTSTVATLTDSLDITSNASSGVTYTLNLEATITDTPVPVISADQDPLDFGSVVQDSAAPQQTLTVSNTGTADLDIGSISLTGSFSIVTDGCSSQTLGTNIGVDDTCEVVVAMSTGTAGDPITGTLSIPSNDTSNTPLVVDLTGVVVPPPLSCTPAELTLLLTGDFDTITCTNNTTADIPVTYEYDMVNFAVADSCGGIVPANGGTCDLTVTYIGITPAQSTLSINDAAGATLVSVQINAGRAPVAIPTISQWSMMIVASLLALVAVFGLRRKES